jgi:2,3-bisphosphoglycerate-independent phosphoglycerate mutase
MPKTPFVPRQRPVVLCILDGWGERNERDANAIAEAKTPNLDRLRAVSPTAHLEASELYVGLPRGQMGNSEVGHMNLGAGRVVLQDLPRIDQALAEGTIGRNAKFLTFVDKLKASGGTAHLMGLLSPGGVHSHQDHMAALARLLADHSIAVKVHGFLDGRDTPPRSAEGYLRKFLADVADKPGIELATLCGRYYAMDRDKRWDRVAAAYAALVLGDGETAADPIAAIEKSYAAGIGDEFVLPTAIANYRGMNDGDGLLMVNFRADRVRQILTALLDPDFTDFPRPRHVEFAAALGMSEYSHALNRFLPALFPPQTLPHVMGELVAEAGLRQLRIAETEKYAHVTFFFNGGEEREFANESRILVPSPKVRTYDLKPEMSAIEVTDKLVAAIESDKFDFIVVNYANTDMVGHTGDLQAAIRAVETVDTCIGRVAKAVQTMGGAMLITADHGNAEMMVDPKTHEPHTAHTLNPVPVIAVNAKPASQGPLRLRDGTLADVAPTLLEILGLPQPAEMTGQSLIIAGPATVLAKARART